MSKKYVPAGIRNGRKRILKMDTHGYKLHVNRAGIGIIVSVPVDTRTH